MAYIIARLRLALGKVGEDERWLLYPTLLLGDIALLAILLCWPLALSITVGRWSGIIDYYPPFLGPAPAFGSFGYWFQVVAGALIAMGSWWTLLGGAMVRRPTVLRPLLRPFREEWVRALGRWVIPTGIVTVVIGAIGFVVLTW